MPNVFRCSRRNDYSKIQTSLLFKQSDLTYAGTVTESNFQRPRDGINVFRAESDQPRTHETREELQPSVNETDRRRKVEYLDMVEEEKKDKITEETLV